jgi:hypothetical protein
MGGYTYRRVHSSDCWTEKLKPYGSCLFSFYVFDRPFELSADAIQTDKDVETKVTPRRWTSINQNRLVKYLNSAQQ